MIEHLGFPFLMGLLLVGAGSERTLAVIKGQPLYTVLTTLLVGVCSWYNIKYVVERQLDQYIAFTIGAALVCALIAYREKRRNQAKEEE